MPDAIVKPQKRTTYVALLGNPIDGLAVHGPFEGYDDADAYVEHRDDLLTAWVAELVPPDGDSPMATWTDEPVPALPSLADRDAVVHEVREWLRERAQRLYAEFQTAHGTTGDVAPGEDRRLTQAEVDWAHAFANFLVGSLTDKRRGDVGLRWVKGDRILSFDECEELGLDGTGRDL